MEATLDTMRLMLRNVVDPELGLNIIDLGLIYKMELKNNKAYILMTFTTQGCPLSRSLIEGVYEALSPLNLDALLVDTTFSPPWTPDLLSDEGKRHLGVRG